MKHELHTKYTLENTEGTIKTNMSKDELITVFTRKT